MSPFESQSRHVAGGRARARATASPPPVASPARGDREAVCEVQCVDELKVERARRALPQPDDVALLAETFRTLGDPTRLRIVSALACEELCVCDIATLLGASQSAVSHSLRALRQLRLVKFRKVGKIAYYSLDDAHIATLLAEGLRHVEDTGAGDGKTSTTRGRSTPRR